MSGLLPNQLHVIGCHSLYSCTPKRKRGQRFYFFNGWRSHLARVLGTTMSMMGCKGGNPWWRPFAKTALLTGSRLGRHYRARHVCLCSSFAGERMPPAQAGKLFIVAVGGNPFAAGLNGKGGKPDIGNQIARGRKRSAQAGENLPVAGTPRDYLAIGLLTNLPREIQCRGNWARGRENAQMSHDAKETAQHMVADALGLAALDNFLQPLSVTRMIHRVFALGIDEDV